MRLLLPALAALWLLQAPGQACTPFVQLIMLYSPLTLWSMFALKSASGPLFLAGLVVVVMLKCGIFLWKSEFRGPLAVAALALGNVVTTLIGLLLVLTVIPPAGLLFSILLLPLFNRAARVLTQHKIVTGLAPGSLACLLFLGYIASLAAFGFSLAYQRDHYVLYWLFKFIYAAIGGGIGLLLSFIYEEAVVAWVYRKARGEQRSFLDPVFWANVAGFVAAVGTAAALTLPERLRSPGFLIGLLQGWLG